MSKYHFLKGVGKAPQTKEFDSKKEAIEAAKQDSEVLLVQCAFSTDHIYKKDAPEVAETASTENEGGDNTRQSGRGAATMAIIIAFLFALCFPLNAATTIGVLPINTAPKISTGITAGMSGVTWTNSINVAYTNLTLVNPGGIGFRDTALQFTVGVTAAPAGPTNVVWLLARNVSGGSTTNLNGSPMLLDYFAFVTNQVPTGAVISDTVVVNLSSIPTTPAKVGIATSFNDGAIPNIFVYSVTPPASTVLTNVTVYSNGL